MSRLALAAAGFAAASALAVGTVLPTGSARAQEAEGTQVAPYVDLSANSADMLDRAIADGGLRTFTAAFVLGSGCKPIWGDTLGIEDSTVNPRIDRARAAGAEPIISFGGAGGIELGQSCTDETALTAAYQSVIDKYQVSKIDFDVEGGAIGDTASVERRFRAIKALQDRNPGLQVSVTIPVLETGPVDTGRALLAAAAAQGVRLDVINAMVMDYGHPVDDMAGAAKTAAAGTLSAAQESGLDVTWANIGVTPMTGANDSAGETVSQDDARAIVAWAKEQGVGRLAFWSVGRDQPCPGGGAQPTCSGVDGAPLDFTKVFTAAG
ncbi:chitinase [Luteipulveratus sp. YIM 133132]|uniref:chitinase n=1 Tax=Luteipulveratus flavus TaxID=3031728 RepID=UPI0023AEC8E9|nr:chitinase [Luteipulveratus sp. YIM 133132]MDE9366956.1 chitinase [Luteipulveratus sp. YIM 133132]